jgi:hypothetical protein
VKSAGGPSWLLLAVVILLNRFGTAMALFADQRAGRPVQWAPNPASEPIQGRRLLKCSMHGLWV